MVLLILSVESKQGRAELFMNSAASNFEETDRRRVCSTRITLRYTASTALWDSERIRYRRKPILRTTSCEPSASSYTILSGLGLRKRPLR